MIDINLTLVVQIIHFGVAYFLIRTLFLKPLLEVISQEDRREQDLKHNVLIAEKEKTQQGLVNEGLWASAQRSFATARPEIEQEPPVTNLAFTAPAITNAEIKQKQELLTRDILTKWEHDES